MGRMSVGFGPSEEQEIIVGQDSADLGPLTRLGFNMAGKSLPEGKTRSRDVAQIPVTSVVFPSIDSGLQLNSIALEGVTIQSAGRLGGSKDFLIPIFLFHQPPPLETQLPMAMMMSTFKIGDRCLGWKGGTTPLLICTNFDSKANEKIIGTNHDDSVVLEINGSDEHLDEVINSLKFEIRDILKGSGSRPDYGVDMSNLGWASTNTLISGSIRFATRAGNPQFGAFAPSPIPNNHPSQDRIGSILLDVQTFEWKPGWDFGWFDYTRPALALKLFVLDKDPKPPDPYTSLKSDLLWKLFQGWCKTASRVAAGVVGSYHLWVVNGQGGPPEDATKTISTLDLKLVSRFQS